MPWSGSAYNAARSFVADRAANINPQASLFDQVINDIASGISACLHAGGQNAVSADISWGGNKISNLGTPTASTDAANKAYVDSVGTTGDLKFSVDSTARSGWICYSTEDFTVAGSSLPSIGNASSNATVRANADTADLFALLYDTYTSLTLQDDAGSTVSRGASAAADYALNYRLVLPDILGRTLGVAGTSGDTSNVPTARSTGDSVGEEDHQLSIAEMPTHGHGITGATHLVAQTPSSTNAGAGGTNRAVDFIALPAVTQGSDTAHNTMQPTFYMHIHMKL